MRVVEISALKGTGIQKAAEKKQWRLQTRKITDLQYINLQLKWNQFWIPSKTNLEMMFPRNRAVSLPLASGKDEKIQTQMKRVPDVTEEITRIERELDDDTESIITNERYVYISLLSSISV